MEQASDTPNSSVHSSTSNQTWPADQAVSGGNDISAIATTSQSANGFVDLLQQPNLMASNNSPDGIPQSITAGKLSIRMGSVFRLHVTQSDEIALYDRQIRLWGVKAQEK